MRSAMCAASQLPGREPTDVDDAPQKHMILPELSSGSIIPLCAPTLHIY